MADLTKWQYFSLFSSMKSSDKLNGLMVWSHAAKTSDHLPIIYVYPANFRDGSATKTTNLAVKLRTELIAQCLRARALEARWYCDRSERLQLNADTL
jgi:hypothetical protein